MPKLRKTDYMRADQLNRELRLLYNAARLTPGRATQFATALTEMAKQLRTLNTKE